MKIYIKEKNLILGFYFITLLLLLFDVTDNIPFSHILRKIEYPYIAVMIILFIRNGILHINKKAGFVMAFLLLHTILFGIVFVNNSVDTMTYEHCRQLITVYLLIFFTADYIFRKGLKLEFYKLSYCAIAIFLLWCAFTHSGDFVNPVYLIKMFSRTERIRAGFGIIDVNYCGNYCLFGLIMSILLLIEWKKEKIKPSIQHYMFIIIADTVILYMLLSTASRSAVICLVLFCFLTMIFNLPSYMKKYYKLIYLSIFVLLALIVITFLTIGYFDSMWGDSNRERNWDINYPIFTQYNHWLTGMGFIENSGFLNCAYGYTTTALDVYYLYILFSTGIIGCILIIIPVMYLLYNSIRYIKVTNGKMIFSLYLTMLFYAVWQVNLFNYRYHTGIVAMITLLLFLFEIDKRKAPPQAQKEEIF